MTLFENNHTIELVASCLFGIAVVHTFLCKKILEFSHRFRADSPANNFFHFLGEVEVVFGFWAFIFICLLSAYVGTGPAAEFLAQVNFTEAVFVFVIMCISATQPVLQFTQSALHAAAKLIPLPKAYSFYFICLVLGPLLGSLITEPAAMTVTALMMRDVFFNSSNNNKFKYATLGILFVNVSVGGTLTHFAAPPLLMVARPWNWGLTDVFFMFGWKAALSASLGALATAIYFRSELKLIQARVFDSTPEAQPKAQPAGQGVAHSSEPESTPEFKKSPMWIIATHIVFMAIVIAYHTQIGFFLPLFLIFVGWTEVTKEYQSPLRIKEGLLVGFFLGGLVTLGQFQGWWLKPIITSLSELPLYFGALSLTAVTDNAALTFLGTLVPNLPDVSKYALVAGAVAGGGLTVIANAPNPAGYGILSKSFGDDGISPGGLFLGALPYTILVSVFFLLL